MPRLGWAIVAGWLVASIVMLDAPWSFYRSPAALTAYFGGGPAELASWSWPVGSWSWDEAPFRYRVLFHGSVDALATIIAVGVSRPTAYWLAMLVAQSAAVVLAALGVDRLVSAIGGSGPQRVGAQIAWLALPPVHLAFAYPVQTKEDFLAYALLFFGLAEFLRGRWRGVLVISMLGALTRETLLLLPLVHALGYKGSWQHRLAPLGAALSIHAGLRLALGHASYDALKLDENFSSPAAVIVSLALVLGAGWAWLRGPGPLSRWLPVALVMLVGTHLVLGRVQEIRISLLLAPWLLSRVVEFAGLRVRWLALVGTVVAIVAVEGLGWGRMLREVLNPHIDQFASRVWSVAAYAQIVLLAGVRLQAREPPADSAELLPSA